MSLKDIFPQVNKSKSDLYSPFLFPEMDAKLINTPLRKSAFLANIAHESGLFIYVKELASGYAYEGRISLGNTKPGDGIKFKGRGLIQITGKNNYSTLSQYLFNDYRLLYDPSILEQPEYAVKSAIWFWNSRNLNLLADKVSLTDGDYFAQITKKINGGLNGFNERLQYYKQALKYYGN